MSSLGYYASSFYFQRQDWGDSQHISQPFGSSVSTPGVESARLMYQPLAHHSETEFPSAGPGNLCVIFRVANLCPCSIHSLLGCPSGHPSSSYQGVSEHFTGLEYSSPPQDLHHGRPCFSPYPNTESQPQPLTHNSTYFPLAARDRHNVAEVNSMWCDDQLYLYTQLSHGHPGTANSPHWVGFNPQQSMIENVPPTDSDWVSYFPPTQSQLVNTGQFIQSTSEPDHHPKGIEQNDNNINGGSTQQHTESPRMVHVVEKSSVGHLKKRGQEQAHIQHKERSLHGSIKSSLIECEGRLEDGSKCHQMISYDTCKPHLKVHFPGPRNKKDKVICPWCEESRGWQNLGRHYQEHHLKFRRTSRTLFI